MGNTLGHNKNDFFITTDKGVSGEIDLQTRKRESSIIVPPGSPNKVRRSIIDGTANPIEILSLPWQNRYPVVPFDSESAMIPILIPYSERERGMVKHHPRKRLENIVLHCMQHDIELAQALSLRRLHIIHLNSHIKDMSQLGLGKNSDILYTSNLFKSSVSKYLKLCDVSFRTREDHQRESFQMGEVMPPTPEFLLTSPVRFIAHHPVTEDSGFGEHGQTCWIETKMMYGASTIPDGSDSAVGTILSTAKKYIETYGPGAYVFAYGCGSKLKSKLKNLGISVLDSNPLDLTRMENYQKGWCGKGDTGTILP